MRLQDQTGRDRNLAAGVKSNNHHTLVYLRKAVTSKPKKIEIRRCSYFVAPEVISDGHLAFNIAIFSRKAIANQSEKVGLSQIQQPPCSRVPLKGRNI